LGPAKENQSFIEPRPESDPNGSSGTVPARSFDVSLGRRESRHQRDQEISKTAPPCYVGSERWEEKPQALPEGSGLGGEDDSGKKRAKEKIKSERGRGLRKISSRSSLRPVHIGLWIRQGNSKGRNRTRAASGDVGGAKANLKRLNEKRHCIDQGDGKP